MDADLKKNIANLLNIINFSTKDNFTYLNRTRNLEITLTKIINNIEELTNNDSIKKIFRTFKLDLGKYKFSDDRYKKELLIRIYDFFKDNNFEKNVDIKLRQNIKKKEVVIDPDKVEFFFNNISKLPFVKESEEKKLNSKGLYTILDLLYCFPKKYTLFEEISEITREHIDTDVQVKGRVVRKNYSNTRKKFMIIDFLTEFRSIKILLFNYKKASFLYKLDNFYTLRGKLLENNYFSFHMIHPQIVSSDEEEEVGVTQISYGTTGLSEHRFKNIIDSILNDYSSYFIDFIPKQFLKENSYFNFYDNIKALHRPDDDINLDKLNERLKFEEFFILSIKNLIKKRKIRNKEGISIEINKKLHQEFLNSLSFDLTNDQEESIKDIFEDISASYPANRLIQGDVGSGKTIVAASAILQVVKSGSQVILMVPTEILAYQHYNNLIKVFKNFDINIQLFVSKMKKKAKDLALLQMAHGKAQVFIGTHALIQKRVVYRNPALVIVDEQHRFGVLQRKKLQDMAKGVNVLLLSATPIPRTLSLGLFGDLDISYIEEMPKSRKKIITRLASDGKRELNKVFSFVNKELEDKRQAYIVFPLIEESESLNLHSLDESFEEFSNKYFKNFKTAFLHGKMKADEKEKIMNSFKDKKIDVLFSTTVIEVGIDVPNASIMLVMNAERFGLSQLHQIRGRVGRGKWQSYCFLVSPKKDSARLNIMEKTNNGFDIAKEDLKLRGPGDIYGVDQSGVQKFKFLDFSTDEGIILTAMRAADRYLRYDPEFKKSRQLKKYLDLIEKTSYLGIS